MNWIIPVVVVALFTAVFALKRASLVSAEQAREFLRQGALVVDVRGPGEFQSGHLPGAVNIPLDELPGRLPRRVKDKNQLLLLHCLSGMRSGIAKRQLKAMGYANVFNLGSLERATKIVQAANPAGKGAN